MHINATVAFTCDRARNVVTDSQCAKTFAPAFTQCAECVCGFPALADGEYECLGRHRRVAMTKLAREFDFGGNIRESLDKIFPRHPGMQSGAATGENNAPDVA